MHYIAHGTEALLSCPIAIPFSAAKLLVRQTYCLWSRLLRALLIQLGNVQSYCVKTTLSCEECNESFSQKWKCCVGGGGGEILKTRTPQGSDCICWFRRGDSVRSIASELVFFSHPPISPALSQGRQGMPIYPKIAHHNTRVKDKEWQSFTAPLLRCCSL